MRSELHFYIPSHGQTPEDAPDNPCVRRPSILSEDRTPVNSWDISLGFEWESAAEAVCEEYFGDWDYDCPPYIVIVNITTGERRAISTNVEPVPQFYTTHVKCSFGERGEPLFPCKGGCDTLIQTSGDMCPACRADQHRRWLDKMDREQ